MYRIFCLVAILGCIAQVKAQRVGIGIAAPNQLLHLHSSEVTSLGQRSSMLFTTENFGAEASKGMRVGFIYSESNESNRFGYITIPENNSFAIYQHSGIVQLPRFHVNSIGNIGIGNVGADAARLHVENNVVIQSPLNNSSTLYLRSGTNNGLLFESSSSGTATLGRISPILFGGASAGISIRQNNYVGMGVVGMPQYPLHIHSTSDVLSTSGIAFTHSGLGENPENGMKIGFHIPNSSVLPYGFIQWPVSLSFNFFQGQTARLSIDGTGKVNIGAPSADARLHVRDDVSGTSAMMVENRQIGGGVNIGMTSRVRDLLGVAVDARAENADGSTAATEAVGTALRASAGSNKNAIMANASNGIAVRARATSSDGYALYTSGRLKFDGNVGEPNTGKVLTSDDIGNATWQNIPVPTVNRLDNNLNFLSLTPDGRLTLEGSHLVVRSSDAPAPIFNPAASDGRYFFWNSGKGALRAGQFFFNQLRWDSIGEHSVALGQRVMAKEANSVALGKDARGVAIQSHAYGNDVEARSFREMALGSFNQLVSPINATAWNADDRLLVIGNGTSNANRSNALVMLKNGNTGIGINSPIAPLHIENRLVIERPSGGSGNIAALEWRSDGSYRGGLGWDASAGRFFFFDGESGTNTLLINNGRVGILRDPTTNALEVNGNASKSSAGDWIANSDARLKKLIIPLQNPLEKLLQLQGVTYEWNDTQTGTERPKGTQMGFTAQNVQQVFPQLVSTDAQGFLQTAYGTYDALYVEAIRQLVKRVEDLEKELKQLKSVTK